MWRAFATRKRAVVLWIIFFILIFLFMIKYNVNWSTYSLKNITTCAFCLQQSNTAKEPEALGNLDTQLWSQTLDFDKLNFSNETGTPSGCYLVPNHLHYVHFGGNPFNYMEMICALAAFKNQRPEKIFFHHDNKERFSGKYWEVLANTPGYMDVVEFHEVVLPEEIFGQPLSSGWRTWHGSHITRLRIIMTYGGIYLDNDCYVIKSIDDYRSLEISVNWDEGQFLEKQVIIAHKDARFLKKWLDTYKEYDQSQWYYNAGENPTVEVLYKEPELIHRVKEVFGPAFKYSRNVFQQQWSGWKDMYAIHLLQRWQSYFDYKSINEKATFPVEFNEINIAYYPITFREMAYDVYDVANLKWPQDKFDK